MAAARAPERVASTWARLGQTNRVVAVADTLLRGTGQVMFQNNPLTGLLFLVGIFVNSVKFGLMALLGVAVSSLAAYLLGVDRTLIRNGLFGFNGVLVGIGVAFFLEYDLSLIAYVILGAIVSAVVMMALVNLLRTWDMPALTAPFVLTTWMLLFAVFAFDLLRPSAFIVPAVPEPEAEIATTLREGPDVPGPIGLTAGNLTHVLFRGIGEVMFQDNLWTGVIFVIAILVNSRVSFVFAVLGSALGGLTALALASNGVANFHGLYGFNSVLTSIALGGLFLVLDWKSTIYAIVGTIFAAVVFGAMASMLSPIGMPPLTAPFVLTTWLFLLPKAGFTALRPVALSDVTRPEHISATYRRRPPATTPQAEPGLNQG